MADDMKNATEQTDEKVNPFKAEADAENAKRTGVGFRVFYGYTRGRGTQPIKWEAFDTDKPETLPTSPQQLSEVTKVTDGKLLLQFMIDGCNDYMYRQASDPIAEFVNPAWDDETKLRFRNVIRNYSVTAEVSIEEAVALMKPGVEKVHQAKLAAAQKQA
jgi:hypothetical protein